MFDLKPDNVLKRIIDRCGAPVCQKCGVSVDNIVFDAIAGSGYTMAYKVVVTCHGATETFEVVSNCGKDPNLNRLVFKDIAFKDFGKITSVSQRVPKPVDMLEDVRVIRK